MRTITWGIIGAGDVCEKKSAPAMYKLAGSRVKSVMRRDLQKARDFAFRHKIEYAFDDASHIFNDPEIDIVYVSTPPSTHAEYALMAARSGKAAYVEKPMARTFRECVQMNETFDQSGLPLFVAYYRRTLPNFLKVRELVDRGAIGEIRTVEITMNKTIVPDNVARTEENWRVDPGIAGGGYFYDLASHQLDFLDYIFGPVVRAQGITANHAGRYKAEDVVTAGFQFENGVVGSGTWCFTTAEVAVADMTTITGDQGVIRYPSFGEPFVILETDRKGKEEFRFDLPEYIQSLLVQTILDELRGDGLCPSTGRTAARTNRVLETIVQNRSESF